MPCDVYLPLLSGHLDNQNTETEEKRLQAHLKTCKHCRVLLKQLEENDALLCVTTPEPPQDFTQRVLAQVHKEPRKSPMRRKWISLGGGALAAAALLVLVLLQVVPTAKDKTANEFTMQTVSAVQPQTDTNEVPMLYATGEQDAYANTSPKSVNKDMLPGEELYAGNTTGVPQTVAIPEPATEQQETAVQTQPTAAPPTVSEPPAVSDPPETAHRRPPIIHTDELAEKEPLLVIWGTNLQLPSELSELLPAEVPTAPAPPESLQQRFLNALPLLKRELDKDSPLSQQTTYTITAFRADYEALSPLMESLLGHYELAAYYPAVQDFTQLTVLFIGMTQENLDYPNF